MTAIPRIRQLPGAESARVRSAALVPSIAGAVVELLRNSIDARATFVRIEVDAENWSVSVADDGIGIHPDDLKEIGRRHYSSKTSDSGTFGFRGEALASIATFSTLHIESRVSGLPACNTSTIRTHGTIITLSDIFATLPVRRKTTEVGKVIDDVRRAVEGVLLVVPEVSVLLIDRGTGKRVLDLKKAPSLESRFRQLHGSLADEVTPFSESHKGIHVDGILSLGSVSTKSLQFIYVNRIPIEGTPLYDAINSIHAPALDGTGHGYYLISISLARGTDPPLDPVVEVITGHLIRCGAIQPPKPSKQPSLPQPDENMPPELEAPRPWNLLGIRGLDLDHELHRTPGPQSAPPAEKKIAVEETVDSENARYVGIWDPVARRKVWVDGRTGNTYKNLPGTRETPVPASRIGSAPPRLNEKEGEASWARALLARWQNPVYPAAQQAISKHASTDARISRAQLENARVVGQLDKKFILCFAEGAVIAVDQHAADERIRFEKFLSLFPNPEVASVRVVVELDPREMAAFERNKDEFARWGFVGRVIGGRISLEGIPEVVKDRFSDAAAVKTLLKEQLRELEHPSVRGTASIAAKTAGMPRLLKEALASRACRSSVMFGDVLAKDEMEGLVKRLAGCEVPWSCAHGRPSMAPLAQIGET